MVREVSWNMPGDQLRTFVERNQKKEMDGNTPSSVSSATYTGFIQVFFLEGGGGMVDAYKGYRGA